MATLIIQTKVTIPPLSPVSLPRPGLIERLNLGLQSGHRLFSITAPAGYGKTSLMCQWAHQSPTPNATRFCWYSLDEQDNDTVRFWSYLAASLEVHLPELSQIVQGIFQGDLLHSLPTEWVVSAIISALSQETQPLALILDDYQVIENEAIHKALRILIDYMPAAFHLALTSRSEPPFNLPRLCAHDQLDRDAARFPEFFETGNS